MICKKDQFTLLQCYIWATICYFLNKHTRFFIIYLSWLYGVMHTFTTEADITFCSKYTTTIVVHSWPYLYNCIVKKVSPQYVVWSTYAMYSLCTLYCSTINVKILYVQNIDLSPSVCMYYKLYTILYLMYTVLIEGS